MRDYRILRTRLHPVAEDVVKFCKKNWGVTPARISVEEPIAHGIEYVTTLNAAMADYHLLCIDVSTRAYNASLLAFALECKNRGLPVRLFSAIPARDAEGNVHADASLLRTNGVGIIEVEGENTSVTQNALSLSLTGVRAINMADFPARFRQPLSQASETFRNGDPAKGCSDVYDEIEALSRRLAIRAVKNGWWKKTKGPPKVNLQPTTSWARVVEVLLEHLDAKAGGCPMVTSSLLHQIAGITSHRNQTSHKPSSRSQLTQRDTRLRTRFEAAIDLFSEFVDATRAMRL